MAEQWGCGVNLVTLATEPVYLVKGDAEPALWWLQPALIAVGAVVVVAAALLLFIRARRGRDDREAAFRALAGRLGVSRATRGLLRKLAGAHGSASPVALLLSDHALRTAAAAIDGDSLPRSERRALEGLRAHLGM